jgi:hypothetical protein
LRALRDWKTEKKSREMKSGPKKREKELIIKIIDYRSKRDGDSGYSDPDRDGKKMDPRIWKTTISPGPSLILNSSSNQ